MNRTRIRTYAAWIMLIAATRSPADGPCDCPEARQFDFWIGEWNVLNRRLGSDGWRDAGKATVRVHPVAGGCAIVEHWIGDLYANRMIGFSLRAFDRETEKWVLVLNWPQPNAPGFGTLDGSFRHNRGEFFSTFQSPGGKESRQRYTFSDIGPSSFRWDQSRSDDGGVTWATNWIMEFSRRGDDEPRLENGPTSGHDRCKLAKCRAFDFLLGEWKGEMRFLQANGSWVNAPAKYRAQEILEGCAITDFLEVAAPYSMNRFHVRGFDGRRSHWVEYGIDDRHGVLEHFKAESQGSTALISKSDADARLYKSEWSQENDSAISWRRQVSNDGGATWSITHALSLRR